MKKSLIVIIGLVLLLIISLSIVNLTVTRKLKTEITIKASSKIVWEILSDHDSFPEWNPFIKNISGSTEPGENLVVSLQLPDGNPMEFTPKVLINEPEKEFRWIGILIVKGVFDGEHYFVLEQISPNETRFIQGENFTGILSGLMMTMIGKNTLTGFNEMNEALKNRAENL